MDKYEYFFNNYDITKEGIIINKRTGKQWKGCINNRGYRMFTCRYKNKHFMYSIHTLLAIKYIPNPNNYPIINHIDGNKLNNSIDNLEWCSYSHNTKEIIKIYNSIIEASKELKINRTGISKCCRGRLKTSGGYIWKYA